jgi:hypothetical protein
LRILEILERKDEQANLNLGDPSAFLNVYDPDKEAEKVTDFMADGLSPEQVEATLDKPPRSRRRQRRRLPDANCSVHGGRRQPPTEPAQVPPPASSRRTSTSPRRCSAATTTTPRPR